MIKVKGASEPERNTEQRDPSIPLSGIATRFIRQHDHRDISREHDVKSTVRVAQRKLLNQRGGTMSAHDKEPGSDEGLTRRAALGRAGSALAAVGVPALLLQGCGGSSASGGSTPSGTINETGHLGT